MASAAPRLEGHRLFKQLGGRAVVDRVDLYVEGGEVVGLLGPNGAGKSTIFRLLMGLLRPDGGRVTLGSQEITGWPTHRRAATGLGYLSQQPSVFTGLSTLDNLRAVLELCGRSTDQAEPLVRAMGLGAVRGQRAAQLSGGERRRLELARLLALDPALALLDEPFKGLDSGAVQRVTELIEERTRRGRGVLITDHAMELTRELCQRVYLLVDGQVVATGAPGDLPAALPTVGARLQHEVADNTGRM